MSILTSCSSLSEKIDVSNYKGGVSLVVSAYVSILNVTAPFLDKGVRVVPVRTRQSCDQRQDDQKGPDATQSRSVHVGSENHV